MLNTLKIETTERKILSKFESWFFQLPPKAAQSSGVFMF